MTTPPPACPESARWRASPAAARVTTAAFIPAGPGPQRPAQPRRPEGQRTGEPAAQLLDVRRLDQGLDLGAVPVVRIGVGPRAGGAQQLGGHHRTPLPGAMSARGAGGSKFSASNSGSVYSPPTRRVHGIGEVGLAVGLDQRLGVDLGVVGRLVPERAGGGEVPPAAGVVRDAPDDGETGGRRLQRGVDQGDGVGGGEPGGQVPGRTSARRTRCRCAGRRRPSRTGRRTASRAPPSSPWRRRSRCPAAAARRPRSAGRNRAAGCSPVAWLLLASTTRGTPASRAASSTQ